MSELDAKIALEAFREYYATVTNEQFIADLHAWVPEIFEDDDTNGMIPNLCDPRHHAQSGGPSNATPAKPDALNATSAKLDELKERPMNGSSRNGAKKSYKIVLLPGDGIGPEVVAEGVKVLRAVERRFGHRFDLQEETVGGAAIDRFGVPLQPETLARARESDAVLLGAVGGPKWDDPKAKVRPEQAVLALRKELGLYANLRPVRTLSAMVRNSTFKPE